MGSAQVDERYGFSTVADVMTDPFPPGIDPATVRLPSVPKLRSAEDDEAHHREYWRAHVWATLRRYRVAFEDPVCPPSLRADHGRVADEARHLAERVTAAYPIRPMDSVACHEALKDLTAGAAAIERTVAALRGAPVVLAADPPTADPRRAATGSAASRPMIPDAPSIAPDAQPPGAPPAVEPSPGVHGQDFFAPAAPSRGLDLRLSLRGARGLRRGRALAEGRSGDDPAVDEPACSASALDEPAADSTV
jgi:hypothetical protein